MNPLATNWNYGTSRMMGIVHSLHNCYFYWFKRILWTCQKPWNCFRNDSSASLCLPSLLSHLWSPSLIHAVKLIHHIFYITTSPFSLSSFHNHCIFLFSDTRAKLMFQWHQQPLLLLWHYSYKEEILVFLNLAVRCLGCFIVDIFRLFGSNLDVVWLHLP